MSEPRDGSNDAQLAQLRRELAERDRMIAQYRDDLLQTNARLQQLIDRISSELKVANTIHQMLVPTEFPNISGFEFSTKFVPSPVSGGDYFDIFNLHDRMKFGVLLASSSGYAASALLLSVFLKLTSQSSARKADGPGDLLLRLSQELSEKMSPEASVDIFYGVVDRRRYELAYVLRGDVLAVHVSSQSEVHLLEALGPAMTAAGSGQTGERLLTLNPKDKLIICSRGIVETSDLSGRPLGTDAVLSVIKDAARKPVHEVRHDVLFAAQMHASGAEPKRDQTVVALEVKDRVIKLAR